MKPHTIPGINMEIVGIKMDAREDIRTIIWGVDFCGNKERKSNYGL